MASNTSLSNWIWGLILIAVVVYFGVKINDKVSSSGPGSFDLSNMYSTGAGGVLSFSIRNTNGRSDEVVMYLLQNGMTICPHKARMDAGSLYDIQFYCPEMGLGEFTVTAAWSSYRPEIAARARTLD